MVVQIYRNLTGAWLQINSVISSYDCWLIAQHYLQQATTLNQSDNHVKDVNILFYAVDIKSLISYSKSHFNTEEDSL